MGGDSINSYDESNRGVFQDEEYTRQLVSFTGMRFEGENGAKNVTPTDIDGLVELSKENCIIFFELKHSGGVPYGQKKALEEICNGLEAGGKNCVVFVAEHNTPKEKQISAKDAIVKAVYYHGRWFQRAKNEKLYELMLKYVDYIRKQ